MIVVEFIEILGGDEKRWSPSSMPLYMDSSAQLNEFWTTFSVRAQSVGCVVLIVGEVDSEVIRAFLLIPVGGSRI
jgi:hypothetical protein